MKRSDLPTKLTKDGRLIVERRSGEERRQTEAQEIGILERRKRPEPRCPDVVELELSAEEWEKHFGKPGK